MSRSTTIAVTIFVGPPTGVGDIFTHEITFAGRTVGHVVAYGHGEARRFAAQLPNGGRLLNPVDTLDEAATQLIAAVTRPAPVFTTT